MLLWVALDFGQYFSMLADIHGFFEVDSLILEIIINMFGPYLFWPLPPELSVWFLACVHPAHIDKSLQCFLLKGFPPESWFAVHILIVMVTFLFFHMYNLNKVKCAVA